MVRQVRRIVRLRRGSAARADEDALLISVLAAFPDRVARRREAASCNWRRAARRYWRLPAP